MYLHTLLPRQTLSRSDFRFEIRPYHFSTVPDLYVAAMESQEQVSQWMKWLHKGYTCQDAENWVAMAISAWNDHTAFEFIIHDRFDGSVVGSCGLNEIRKRDLFCNLGYWVRSSKVKLGAATQATLLLKEFAFLFTPLNRLEIVVADGNDASRKVAEKVGAVYEGRQQSRISIGNKAFDAHMYALIRPPKPVDDVQ